MRLKMKMPGAFRKLQEKYENAIATQRLFGFTEFYMKTTQKIKEKERCNNGS